MRRLGEIPSRLPHRQAHQLGVGRGAFRYEFDRFGVPVEESRERFDVPSICSQAANRDGSQLEKQYYDFGPLTITPRPVQNPTRRSGLRP